MNKIPVVISASRMTDMPAFYPHSIIEEVEARKAKGYIIHTIVLWTKHAASIFREPLSSYLKEQQKQGTQLYVQLTITGMGKDSFVAGTNNKKVFLEPCVPAMSESVAQINRLTHFVGNAERIRLRVDPLVRLKDAEGMPFSNYDKLPELIALLQPENIRHFTFSFLEKGMYKKIDNRFAKHGIEILPPDKEERLVFFNTIKEFAKKHHANVTACSVNDLTESSCIDGRLLQRLHDEQWPLDLSQPRSRSLCGCTKSIDIGGWPPKTCNSGCIYCYSRPNLPTLYPPAP